MPFSVVLFDVSLCLDTGYTPLVRRDFLFHPIRWHCFNFPITKEIPLDHLIQFLWSSSFFSPTVHQHSLSCMDTPPTALILWHFTYSWPHVNALLSPQLGSDPLNCAASPYEWPYTSQTLASEMAPLLCHLPFYPFLVYFKHSKPTGLPAWA